MCEVTKAINTLDKIKSLHSETHAVWDVVDRGVKNIGSVFVYFCQFVAQVNMVACLNLITYF